MACRSCGARRCQSVLDLGLQPLANNFLRLEDLDKPEPRFPLHLVVCTSCWLLQITETVPPVELFQSYVYFSSYSDSMLEHARRAVDRYVDEFSLGRAELVLEIASNDGYLLQYFTRHGVPCFGIDPAANVADAARKKGIETIVGFFGREMAAKLAAAGRCADLILGNNVLAHCPDINDFVAGLAAALKGRGRIVLEFPSAVDLVNGNEFDTVYHEHIFYFSLTALRPVFARHQLEVFRAERLAIHGGSLRLFAAHRDVFPVDDSVTKLLAEEERNGIGRLEFYRDLARRAQCLKNDLAHLLETLKRNGSSIAAYGASAKGSTLLNFLAPPAGLIDFVADRSPHKQGMFTPGLHLPIMPAEALEQRRPEYTLLLAWNLAAEILQQQRNYRDAGGKFVVPVPQAKIV